MNELSEQLNSLLSDPEQLKSLTQMAQSLLSQSAQSPYEPAAAAAPVESAPAESEAAGLGNLFSGGDASAVAGLFKALGAGKGGDDKTALIRAIKPYLSEARQQKLERALRVTSLVRTARAAFSGGSIFHGL